MQHAILQVLVPFFLFLHTLKMPWGVDGRLCARPTEHNGFPTLVQEWSLGFSWSCVYPGISPSCLCAELPRLKIPSAVLFQIEEV